MWLHNIRHIQHTSESQEEELLKMLIIFARSTIYQHCTIWEVGPTFKSTQVHYDAKDYYTSYYILHMVQ